MNTLKNIAIVAGGNSSEYDISIKSGALVEMNLKGKFNTFLIKIKSDKWIYHKNSECFNIDKNDFSLTVNEEKIIFDSVFIAIHGTPGEDGKLQGYFDMLKIPYSSSGVLSSALCFNKGVCNDYLKNHGVNVAKSIQLFEGVSFDTNHIIKELKLPCFVKPNQAGSSYGISKVSTPSELIPAITYAFKHDNQVLIESFLDGREVTCGVNNFDNILTVMPVTEIITENDFFDFEAKYEGKSQEVTPAKIPENETVLVQEASKKVFRLLGLNGVARVDFIIQNGVPFMIEANTVPGLSTESIIPQQAKAMGYSLTDFFTEWVNHSLKD